MGQGAIYLLTDRPDRSAALETLIRSDRTLRSLRQRRRASGGVVPPQAIVSDLTLSRRESVSRLRPSCPDGKAAEIRLVCLLRSTSDQDLRHGARPRRDRLLSRPIPRRTSWCRR